MLEGPILRTHLHLLLSVGWCRGQGEGREGRAGDGRDCVLCCVVWLTHSFIRSSVGSSVGWDGGAEGGRVPGWSRVGFGSKQVEDIHSHSGSLSLSVSLCLVVCLSVCLSVWPCLSRRHNTRFCAATAVCRFTHVLGCSLTSSVSLWANGRGSTHNFLVQEPAITLTNRERERGMADSCWLLDGGMDGGIVSACLSASHSHC